MNFISKLFGRQEKITISDHAAFWKWFAAHERTFFRIIKKGKHIDSQFLDELIPQLHQLNDCFYCLTGMCDDNTAELVITAEGDIKSFVFVEDLVAAAPALSGWKFTPLKPALGFTDIVIEMDGHAFNNKNTHFFSNENSQYPDEIDITFVHTDYTEENKEVISSGIQIFLENALGELATATLIDAIAFSAPGNHTLIPLEKLQDFLHWREKEFVEKYRSAYPDPEDDGFSVVQAEDEYGMPIIASINMQLLEWDAKPSHPWMMVVEMEFDYQHDGLPDANTMEELNNFENQLLAALKDTGGWLYLGRETRGGSRFIYFTCREYRYISRKVARTLQKHPQRSSLSYRIYKDKYWMTMNKFTETL